MRSIFTVLLTVLIAASSTPFSPDNTDQGHFEQDFLQQIRPDDPRRERLLTALKEQARCKDYRWSCQKACRAQRPFNGNDTLPLCMIPHPEETCFGQPIDYKYVPSRSSLPVEYEVLRRFPRCWSVLAPMLCGMIYRPCDVRPFTAKLTSSTMMEVWQRFGIGMCKRVHELCEDAIKEGFFPSELVDCKRTAENVTWLKQRRNATGPLAPFVLSGSDDDLRTEWDRQTVFTEENCQIKYTENASRHEPMQCIFPLVYTTHERIRPVIDQCFLPCRSPLISSPDKFLSFVVVRAVLCCFFGAICFSIFMFLSSRSKIFSDSDCIFSIACSLLCFSLYLACWGLGSITYFAKSSECTRTMHGVDIRSEPIDHFASTWCLLSAVTSHSSLLASIGFLAAAFPLSAAGATKIRRREDEKKSDSSSGLRASLVALIGIASTICGVIPVFLKMISTDGVAGVCSFGLHSIIHHSTALTAPGLVFCLIALAVGTRDMWREKKVRHMEIEHAVEEKIREGIEHEKSKEKIAFWKDRGPGQKEEIQSIVRQGSLPPVEEKDGESGRGSGGEIERDGEEEVLVLKGDDDEEKQWLSDAQKREIGERVRMEMGGEWRGREKRAWNEAISTRYTLAALCLCIGSLLFGLSIHSVSLANNGKDEYEAVKEYVSCVMSKSIVRRDQEWLAEPVHAAEWWREGGGESDPLVRRHNLASGINIHSCSFPSTGDGRILGLLSVFILLPLLPVSVFIWAFGAGLVGAGGMAMVKERRPKTQKIRDDDDDDVEMTVLTSKRDGDSQRMSSVSSSMDGRVLSRPAGSTVSTVVSSISRLSAASSTSSTHSSVSLRGRLPRFPSAERLMTVRATSPVPSVARSEVVVVPDRRSRSVGHLRRIDIVGRAKERKALIWKKKTRACSAEMEARREGQAEAGQLVAPRNSIDHDARSVSSHSTTRTHQSGVSSSLHPPSQVAAEMKRNAEALMRRSRQTDVRSAGLQQQLQMVQEELLLRALPNDQPCSSSTNQQNPEWFRNLQEVRTRIEGYAMVSNAATPGLMLSAHALNLGRLIMANGTQDYLINHQALQYALERLQALVYHLENGLDVSPQLERDIQEGIAALDKQSKINQMPNVRDCLTREMTLNLDLDIVTPEALRLRDEFYRSETNEERRRQILDELREGANRRAVLRLAEGSLGQLQLVQQAQLQGGPAAAAGRMAPPVYAPMRIIDMTQPPSNLGAPFSSSYSLTNSTVPSSMLTTAEQEKERRIRLYHETYGQPPVYEGLPSTSRAAAAAPSSSSAAASAAVAGPSSDVSSFIAAVLGANASVQPVYAAQSAHFPAPTSSELDNSHDDDDPMSSETSMDSIGRRTTAVASSLFSAGSYAVPIYDVGGGEPSAAATRGAPLTNGSAPNSSGATPGAVPNLFPFVRTDQLPPIPSFPGARPMAPASLFGTQEEQGRGIAQMFVDRWEEQRNGAAAMNGLDQLERLDVPSHPLRDDEEERRRKEETKREKRRTPFSDDEPSCSTARRRNNDDTPPRVGRVRVHMMADGEVNGMAAQTQEQVRSSLGAAAERRDYEDELVDDDDDSGLESLSHLSLRLYVASEDEDAPPRPATREELEDYERERERRVQAEVEDRLRLVGVQPRRDEEEAGPSNERHGRVQLMNRYLNHSNPDLAMEEEEREQREADEKREREERKRVDEARRERIRRAREARESAENAAREEDEVSLSSLLTAEEQADLVRALRDSLAHRSTEGMSEEQRRLVEHLTRALDVQGGISREEIMTYRVYETNRQNRLRQQPDRNSPYSVSSVVISRMSLAEIGARVDAIRRLSPGTLYPLEVYYQLHLADVLWPLNGRDVVLGDNIYTHDDINRVLGADSPLVPEGADSADFHQLMRKRAITAGSLTGRAYGGQRGSQGPTYLPPRLPDQGIYRVFGDPSVVLAAIDGDLQPIRDAIARIPLTMPDVMRLDNRTSHTLGSHLRHFRDFLDAQARVAGFPLREDTYVDAVPPEPTDPSHPTDGDTDGDPSGPQPDPEAEPDF
ncbi:hypothetical protein PENTCL1PPCAC_25960 [Pristionchus entomophagus]|uniref:FZ domain-containing protein n=1 Tax=Pristionchus entomophagus TaxID=358040 RepID=A0AAV5UBE2_9BILA|nr:hypothetical protein PENTCL1PPCAC_25960 [Pristionchus entomophagus]